MVFRRYVPTGRLHSRKEAIPKQEEVPVHQATLWCTKCHFKSARFYFRTVYDSREIEPLLCAHDVLYILLWPDWNNIFFFWDWIVDSLSCFVSRAIECLSNMYNILCLFMKKSSLHIHRINICFEYGSYTLRELFCLEGTPRFPKVIE